MTSERGTDDPDLLVMLREAEKVGQGTRTDLSPQGESPRSDVSNDQTSKTAARLARDHSEEYERVCAGELSINAATARRR